MTRKSLADAQAEFVGMARFEQGHDLHGHESNLGANMVATRPVRGTEGVLAADWKDVECGCYENGLVLTCFGLTVLLRFEV